MKTWEEAAKDAAVSGSAAAVASALVLAAGGHAKSGTPIGPINAVSHWIWGDRAFVQDGVDTRHTLTGWLIHHSAALFWALLYEKLLGRPGKTPAQTVRDAALATTVAFVVDYRFTPRRLMPGYEERVSKKSLLLAYGALGLAAGTALNGRNRR